MADPQEAQAAIRQRLIRLCPGIRNSGLKKWIHVIQGVYLVALVFTVLLMSCRHAVNLWKVMGPSTGDSQRPFGNDWVLPPLLRRDSSLPRSTCIVQLRLRLFFFPKV